MKRPLRPLALLAVTLFTLVAFAANSLLCRMALGPGAVDAASFSLVRLLAGAFMLWILVAGSRNTRSYGRHGDWTSGFLLFLYAVPFSFAYLSLSVGTGALILFPAVQATMIIAGLRSGERPRPLQWAGLSLAMSGLVYLVLPGVSAPSPVGSGLMAVAGIAWGLYSVRGRSVADPFLSTAGNFARAVPFAVAVSVVFISQTHISLAGLLLALVSGAVTSGLGYVGWYWALRGLTTAEAAIVQLAVPVLAAMGGVAVLSEAITLRLTLASIAILGGVGLALLTRRRPGINRQH